MMVSKYLSLIAAVALAMPFAAEAAPVLLNTNQVVGGTTTTLTLNAGSITTNPNGNTSLSNNGGNLVVSLSDPNPGSAVVGDNDFYMQWSGGGDGLGFDAATYRYVQIDVVAITAGMPDANWQVFWTDNDSGIGGGNNSSSNVGPFDADIATPGSYVIDLINGESVGAKGWGPGTVNNFRFDPFQSSGSFGQSFEISAVTFGSELVPEPASLLSGLVGMLMIAVRRRR
jgi:hypothetical protein